MFRGGRIFLAGGCLALAGCAATDQVQVRPIADPAAKYRYGGGLLAEARGQLALGNAGLALETFRKLQREQPASADAFAGIAACYAVMGRYDLARANYEFALAYAPNDPMLLYALASSLDRLGKGDQAGQVRAEASRLTAARPKPVQAVKAQVAQTGAPRLSSSTVKAPAARAASKQSVSDIAPSRLTADTVSIPAPDPLVPKQSAPRADGKMSTVVDAKPPRAAVASAPSMAPPRLSSTSVDLPAIRPAVLAARLLPMSAEASIPATDNTPSPMGHGAPSRQPDPPLVTVPKMEVARTAAPPAGPYLERSSPGEVALVTTPRSVPPKQLEAVIAKPRILARAVLAPAERPYVPPSRPLFGTALRWVPLRFASAPQKVVLLNAARSQGLAARTRTVLLGRGWRSIGIGDAREQRGRSLVLYPAARAFTAQRLAAHFHCNALKSASVNNIVVILGRQTAARRRA